MIYAVAASLVYLALGLFLTRAMQRRAPALRVRINDAVFGALAMPIISFASLVCVTLEVAWSGLLLVLGFDPEDGPPGRNETAAGT